MKAYVQITGLDEKVAALRQFDEQLPDVIQASLKEGTQDVSEALGNYPTQPASIAKPPRQYVRTMAYQQSRVISYTETSSTVETPIDYAVWLRGNGAGYEGAWMHLGVWESISAIIERLTQPITDIFERRINALIWRLFG